MKRFLTIVLVLLAIAAGAYYFWPKNIDQPETHAPETDGTIQTEGVKTETVTPSSENDNNSQSSPIQKVTTTKLSGNNLVYADFPGTVKANEQVKIYPTITGHIATIAVDEGVAVKKGDLLFTISGPNGSKPSALIQAEVAAANYKTAQKNLNTTVEANAASVRSAQLQLESAQHQAQGASLDLQVFDRNLEGNKDGLHILRDTLFTTQRLNELEQNKLTSSIGDLQDGINDLEDKKYETVNSLRDRIDSATDPAEKLTLQEELAKSESEIQTQLEALYIKLEEAHDGYDALIDAATLKENQIFGQIQQTETQGKVLYLNQQSIAQKLGLNGDFSDGVRMAQEGLNAIKIKNDAALSQAKLQVELARLNLESAQALAEGITVRAPFDGVVGDVTVQSGDQVGPQVALTQLSGQQNFELKVNVDIDTADKISPGSLAEVKIGGRYIKMPIKNISPSADPASKLVNITVALPKIFFRTNQTLAVRIPTAMNRLQFSQGEDKTLFVPLDAVIIGTEEQYVFVAENGQARKKNIKLGTISAALAEVVAGIQSSDQIIVEGAKNLVDGQTISF